MDTNDTITQAIARIHESDLIVDEKTEFIGVFMKLQNEAKESSAQLCADNPTWIRKLYENYKSKQAAIAADDPAAWEQIIQEEEKMLREMTE